MSRYIDIEPVIAWIYEAHWQTSKMKSVICRLQTEPCIVQCKDCKWSRKAKSRNSELNCKWLNRNVPCDWFCADGERKDK